MLISILTEQWQEGVLMLVVVEKDVPLKDVLLKDVPLEDVPLKDVPLEEVDVKLLSQ
jgi:hypothetical protein